MSWGRGVGDIAYRQADYHLTVVPSCLYRMSLLLYNRLLSNVNQNETKCPFRISRGFQSTLRAMTHLVKGS